MYAVLDGSYFDLLPQTHGQTLNVGNVQDNVSSHCFLAPMLEPCAVL